MLSLSHLIAPSLEQNDSLFRCVWSSHGIRDLLQCVKQPYYHRYNFIGLSRSTPNDARSDFSHVNSLAAIAMERYSASAEDLDIVPCFLHLHEIGDVPSLTQHPLIDCPFNGQLA